MISYFKDKSHLKKVSPRYHLQIHWIVGVEAYRCCV